MDPETGMSPVEPEVHPRTAVKSEGKPGRIVAVFGAAFLEENSPAYRAALDLGSEIAHRGWTTACGGYGGAMAAVSRGADKAGGHTIGVTCDTLSHSGRQINPWIREEIRCPTIHDRLMRLTRMADAVVALDGGIGTLTEIVFCAVQIQTGELPPRPLLLMGSVWEETFKTFFRSASPFVRESDRGLFGFVTSPEEAVQIIRDHFERLAASGG
jgi:uncharacterized protein (TIGR00730 family)